MATQYQYGDVAPVLLPIATAQAVSIGDLVGLTANTLTRASDEPFVTSIAQTQQNFVAKFIGVSGQQKDAGAVRIFGASFDNICRADSAGTFLFSAVAAQYQVGQLVGPAPNALNNGLLNSTVAGVGAANLAIGVVVEQTAASATSVKVRLLSVLTPLAK